MEKSAIENVLNGMIGSIKKEQIELYKELINKNNIEKIKDIEDFQYAFIHPYESFLHGLISTEISTNDDVAFILLHSRYIDCNFNRQIQQTEGFACCSDKSRTILRALLNFYKTGEKIEFDYTQEYTFHLPKHIFKNHSIIINYYEGLKNLYYGNPEKYLLALSELLHIDKKIDQ